MVILMRTRFGWNVIGKRIYKVIGKGSLGGGQTMSRDDRSGERHISGKHLHVGRHS